jgi:hypothetical protein
VRRTLPGGQATHKNLRSDAESFRAFDGREIQRLIAAWASGKIDPMTTDEFYAHALLAALPVVIQKNSFNCIYFGQKQFIEDIEQCAVLLTHVFENDKARRSGNQHGSNAPS